MLVPNHVASGTTVCIFLLTCYTCCQKSDEGTCIGLQWAISWPVNIAKNSIYIRHTYLFSTNMAMAERSTSFEHLNLFYKTFHLIGVDVLLWQSCLWHLKWDIFVVHLIETWLFFFFMPHHLQIVSTITFFSLCAACAGISIKPICALEMYLISMSPISLWPRPSNYSGLSLTLYLVTIKFPLACISATFGLLDVCCVEGSCLYLALLF